MHMPTPDAELLRRYAEQKDQAAFAELVRQNLPLVYRCACRSLDGDTSRAQDVAQEVFVDLARKAAALARHPALAAWLHTTTRYTAAGVRRGEHRRQQRHEEVRNMHEIESSGPSEPRWERLQPVIDDALASLKEADREAVLLRFFAEKTHAEIGSRLGLAEDAARMRVERALEKLRAQLVRRGIVSAGAALGAALAGQGALAVPAGLAAGITQTALSATVAVAGTGFLAAWLATGGGKLIAGSSLAIALAGGAVAFSRLAGPESQAPAPASVSTGQARQETPGGAWAALVERWDFSSQAERGFLLRSFAADELGARLLGLWRDNNSASRGRFWSIFEHWCEAAPEVAARWSAGIWDEITGADGVKLREQAGFVWVKRSPRPAFEWARTLRDAEAEAGLAARMLWQLAHTDSGEAIALAKDVSDKFYETARFGILEGWFTRDRAAAIERLGDECVKHPRMPDLLGRWSEADVVGFMTWGKLGRMAFSASEEPSFDQRRLRAEAARMGVSRLSDLGKFVSALFVEYLDKTPSLSPDSGQSLMMIDGAFLACCDSFDLWRDRDPVAALKWLQGLPAQAASTQKFLLRWGGTSKENRDGTRDHAARVEILRLLEDSPARTESLKKQIRKWSDRDLEGSLAWMRNTGDANLMSLAYEGSILSVAPEAPDQAVAMYSSLPDGPAKTTMALELASAWAATDHEAARRWLDQAQPKWAEAALADDAGKGETVAALLSPWAIENPDAYVSWLLTQSANDTNILQNVVRLFYRLKNKNSDAAAKIHAAYRSRKSWAEIKPAALAWIHASGKTWPGGLLSGEIFADPERGELVRDALRAKGFNPGPSK